MKSEPEASVSFDFHRITLGNLISIVTGVIAVFLAYSSLKSDIAIMRNDIVWIKAELTDRPSINHAIVKAK